ncbi:MAG: hypothetical protein ACSHW7_00015 [Patiriisocius sp.]|uniref:hypothetical protein n=1 Tax=Patiriisocius sp. TaxID=2822396 RepID=UPI003EF8D9BC
MQEELIKVVRLKALDEGASNTKLAIAKHVSSKIDISISEKAFTNYLKSIEDGNEVTVSKEIRDSLARYLDFESYFAFKNSLQKGKSVERKYVFIIFVLSAFIIALIFFFNRKKCMIWQGNQYVKIHCEEANAKPIDQRLLVNFKKVEPDCEKDFFFNEDGSPRVWYYKKGKNDLELYTMPGEHPINGKTLNDITRYMVNEHLCDSLFR